VGNGEIGQQRDALRMLEGLLEEHSILSAEIDRAEGPEFEHGARGVPAYRFVRAVAGGGATSANRWKPGGI
jgi:hypothetical protein